MLKIFDILHIEGKNVKTKQKVKGERV